MSEVEQKQGLPFIWYGGPPDKAKTVVSIKQNKRMFIVLWPKNIKCAFVGMNGFSSDKH